MKLVVFIPCYNESENLAQTIADLPGSIKGISEVEVVVIDDCSTDDSVEIARKSGVDGIISLKRHSGLAFVYQKGMEAALDRGADIIATADGDNQYAGACLEKLVKPIINGEADVVVGERPIEKIQSFGRLKKWLQRFGSRLVSKWFKLNVPDVTSGFRAFAREAALSLNTNSKYTITIEALAQLADQQFVITSVPVDVNPVTRPSRLMKSNFEYVRRQAATILRLYLEYRPFSFFGWPALLAGVTGVFFWLRFLFFYFSGSGQGHVQSLVLGSALVLTGFLLLVAGCLAHLSARNRRTLERILRETRMKKYPGSKRTD